MSRYLLLPLFALWCFSPCLYADANLEVSLEGLEGELQRNALAWLGVPPESSQERLIYVASVEQKIERSLQALGYYRPYIEVEVQRTDPVWQVSIRVTPGDPVLIRHVSVQLSGEAGQDEAFTALLETAPFAQGEALHHGKFEDFRRQLLALGLQRGYFNGEISTGRVEVEPEGLTADVFLHYASGRRYRFGRVLYDREQIESSVMSSLRTFQPGDHFDQSLMQEFQALLQRTNYFSTVLLRPMLEQADGDEVPIELRLFPAERHSFDVGIGYSTDTEERLSVTWRTPKINRAGHRQETRLQYSPINPSGRFTYTIPLSHPLNDLLLLSARLEDNEYGDLDSNQKELGVRREQRAGNWVRSFSLRGLNESWQIVDFRRDNDYLLPGVSFSRRNRAGSPVNPTSGFSRLYVVEAGSEYLGSDIDLLRAQATLRRVFTPAPRHRFVARSEIGAVFVSDDDRPNLAPSLSFFTGGSQSIRGFGYQSIGHEIDVELEDGSETTLVIGGTRLFTASAEYQYSFTDAWRGAVFADGGDAFDEDDFDFNYSAGVGVHFVTLVGAIRLELAYPLSKDDPSWRFHFAIGAEF
jgi:translocation and assembly module TamA